MTETPTPDDSATHPDGELATLEAVAGFPAVTADADQLMRLADEAKSREVLTIVPARRFVVVTAPGQSVHTFEVDPNEHAPWPADVRGAVTLRDADSFVEYVGRYSDEMATTLWADIDRATITAVLDDHARDGEDGPGLPGWGRHRATLQLRQTTDWLHWLGANGKYLDQRAFAEHLEDGVDAILDPSPAEMLEVAQTFHAKSGANFVSSQQLSGEVEFKFEETVKAKAGQTGTVPVPQTFKLGIAPFEGNDAYPLTARFRYRLHDGNLSLEYRLIRPDRVLQTAFGDIVKAISGGADLPVMAGTPRQR